MTPCVMREENMETSQKNLTQVFFLQIMMNLKLLNKIISNFKAKNKLPFSVNNFFHTLYYMLYEKTSWLDDVG